jgi:uncharacterized protein YaeQ
VRYAEVTMTFVSGFFNFAIDLNHADQEVFTSFRLKVPRHELESKEYFYGRLIAYLHAYREGIELTQGVSAPKDPSIWVRDALGTISLWVHVGVPEKRKLELSLKQNNAAQHRIYLSSHDEIQRFCHHLRGSTTNWVHNVLFYLIPATLLDQLAATESSSPHWSVSFIDDRLYMSVDGVDLESDIMPIDIWEAFQHSLNAA